jgi:hypothetical protein
MHDGAKSPLTIQADKSPETLPVPKHNMQFPSYAPLSSVIVKANNTLPRNIFLTIISYRIQVVLNDTEKIYASQLPLTGIYFISLQDYQNAQNRYIISSNAESNITS